MDAVTGTARLRALEAKGRCPLEEIKGKALALPKRGFPFEQTINRPDMAFICRVEKASPSKRVITPSFPYTGIARDYEMTGASAISMLAGPNHFMGCNQYLTEIKNTVQIPLLHEDFAVDEYQVYEAKVIGVDTVLLICSLLDTETPSSHTNVYGRLGLSALVEAHTEKEVLSTHKAGAQIIGINSRNPKILEVSSSNPVQLRSLVPPEIPFVAKNGVRTAANVHVLYEINVDTIFIRGTLMHSMNKKLELDKLRSGCYLM